MNKYQYIIPIICIIVVIVIYFYTRSVIFDELLGVFVTPESFAKENGVDSIVVIIAEVTILGTISGFIIIDDATIPFDAGIPLWHIGLDHVPVTINLSCENDECRGILPEKATMTVGHGHFILEDDDTVYIAAQWVPIF